MGIRKGIVERNLEIAFASRYSPAERKALAKKVYWNMGAVFFEFLKLSFVPPQKIPRLIQIDGLKILEQVKSEGHGAVLAGAHFGNWELLSAGTSVMGFPIFGYTGQQKNLLVDDAINRIRRRFGMITISKSGQSSRAMIKALKNNQVLAIGADLNVPHDQLFVDFFGEKAAVGQGQAIFTLKLKTPLLFFWNERVGRFKYRGHIERLKYEVTGDLESDRQHIAQLISDRLEEVIGQYPDHYFWFHRRWKTRPPGESGLY